MNARTWGVVQFPCWAGAPILRGRAHRPIRSEKAATDSLMENLGELRLHSEYIVLGVLRRLLV
jgi:hypothetical protein